MIEMSNDNNNTTIDLKGTPTASAQSQPLSESPKRPNTQSPQPASPSPSRTTPTHSTSVRARTRSRSPLPCAGCDSDNNQRQPKATANSICANGLLTDCDHESMMGKAVEAARYSEDPDTKVGACLVDAQQRFVGTGYNQFPPNNSDRPYTWTKDKKNQLQDKRTYVLHAEAVAIMNHRTANLRGATIYSTLMPCNECAKLIILAGIDQVYYLQAKETSKWKYQASHRLLEAAGVKLTQLKK